MYMYIHTAGIMQGTIWTLQKRWEQQLEKGSINVNDKHYIVTKLDPTLSEIFSSAPTSFQPAIFTNDQNSIFRNPTTLNKALQSALKETTAQNVEMGILMEGIKQTRYLREELFYHRYMPVIYVTNALCIIYFFLAKVYNKIKQLQHKQRLQRAVQLRQEREMLLQQLRA